MNADAQWAGNGYTVRPPRHLALGFSAAEVALTEEEIEQHPDPRGKWYSMAVAVYLGDQEVARIYGPDLVLSHGEIMLDETVAQWLSRILARAAQFVP